MSLIAEMALNLKTYLPLPEYVLCSHDEKFSFKNICVRFTLNFTHGMLYLKSTRFSVMLGRRSSLYKVLVQSKELNSTHG